MSHLGTPISLPPDERRTLNLPEPLKPDDDTLRALAQAGVSARGLRMVSNRSTAKKVRTDLESESRRRRAELRRAERRTRILALRAKVLTVVKQGAIWSAIAFIIGTIVYLVGGPLLLAGGTAVGVLIVGPILLHLYRKN
jgi:hypothetical protein